MADTDRNDARKTTRIIGLLTLLVLLALLAVIVFRGCRGSNATEDRIDPDNPLPGTQDATGYHAVPDAAPLLRAA